MINFNTRQTNEPPLLRIEQFRGMDLSVTSTQIDQAQSPDMLNLNIDERGALKKRTGFEKVFPTSLGAGKINGIYEFRKINGTKFFLIAHGTRLYKQSGNGQPVSIYSGLANNDVTFFTMNDKCYMLDGTNYLVFDGSTASPITPYIPQLTISRLPTGGGESLEPFNLLGNGFKDSFSADGTAKDFFLSMQTLDSTPIKVVVNNAEQTLTTHYTVDHVLGKVTFVTAPTKGVNNVEITAYKTIPEYANRIQKCRFYSIFGGSNDSRVFFSGNSEMPDYIWRSGIYDPTYFPDDGFYKFPDIVKGFSRQYDYLIVERAHGKHLVNFVITNGIASFPSKPINDQVGTLAEQSIQIIENNPVSLSKDGVYMLTASSVRDERNVMHISDKVDQKLLNEPNLDKAISIDYDKKYWLAVNGNVYVYDYARQEWYLYNNIKASCFLEMNNNLYFGSNEQGLLYRFKEESELFPYNDDGEPIESYWKSKILSFGADERKKVVERVFFSLRPYVHTSADVYYISDSKSKTYVNTTRRDFFDYSFMNYSLFTYATNSFPQESANKIKAKKIVYFQLEIRNDKQDEGFSLLSLGIKYNYQSYVK